MKNYKQFLIRKDTENKGCILVFGNENTGYGEGSFEPYVRGNMFLSIVDILEGAEMIIIEEDFGYAIIDSSSKDKILKSITEFVE